MRATFSFPLHLLPAFLIGLLLLAPASAQAGPGGEIVELAFKTTIGKIILGILAIIFLPLIIYVYVREMIGVRRTKADLKQLAQQYPEFAWKSIDARVREIAQRLYTAWDSGDLANCFADLSPDYFWAQQEILDRWREEGKHNVVELKKVKQIKPLFVRTEDEESLSILAISITMNLRDYLLNTRTGKIIKGRKKVVTDHEAVWILVLDENRWMLHSIEEGTDSLSYAKSKNIIGTGPLNRSPSASPFPQASEATPLDPAAIPPHAEPEQPVIPVEQEPNRQADPSHINKRVEE